MQRIGFFVCCAFFLPACSLGPAAVPAPGDFRGDGEHAIFIVNHGWHTGIVLPADTALEQLPELAESFPGARYLEFGWGDKDFYQATQVSWMLAARAAILPTATVVRVLQVPTNAKRYFSLTGAVKLCANEAELSALLQFLEGSLEEDGAGPQSLGDTLRDGSQFYVGSGRYHLLNTCNSWTARGLKSLGLDARPRWKLRASSVMNYLAENPSATTFSESERAALSCP